MTKTFFYIVLYLGFGYALHISAQEAVTADQALAMLKAGNERFVNGQSKHQRLDAARRTETSTKGQHPYVTILGCSDSRVPVEPVFDAGIGELFIIRVAGNVVNTDEAGSIEYGTEHLHTPLLVVLGHSQCGAVTAVAQNAVVHGNIPKLVENIGPAVTKAKHEHGPEVTEKVINASITNNIFQSIEDLLEASPMVAGLVKNGKLTIVGALYNIETGRVEWLGPHPQQASLLEHSETHQGH